MANDQVELKSLTTEKLALLINQQYQQIMACQQNLLSINAELQFREKQVLDVDAKHGE
jgi:hypothetical protein